MEAFPNLTTLVIKQLLLGGLISSPKPAGAASGALANKPRNNKTTSSGPRPAGAASGAPANKPRNNKIRTPHSICACGRLHQHSPHTTRHTMHTQKLAHRREFAHAHAHPDKHHTHQDTQCTYKNLHTAGSFRMRARTEARKRHTMHTRKLAHRAANVHAYAYEGV